VLIPAANRESIVALPFFFPGQTSMTEMPENRTQSLQAASIALIIALSIAFLALSAAADEQTILFREDFAALDSWKPFFFPKIKTHSTLTPSSATGTGIGCAPRALPRPRPSCTRIPSTSTNIPLYAGAGKCGTSIRRATALVKAGDDFPCASTSFRI